jgi:predicted esterase YcpF (UPF0227 family)
MLSMTAPPLPVTHLLYLHGFRSSPRSAKAQQLARAVRERHPQVQWWCPQLPASPAAAMAMVMRELAHWPRATAGVIGSSLGGFYATHVAESLDCRAVLLNPAVDPARDLAGAIGEHAVWHEPAERFFFAPEFVAELRALEHGEIRHPENYFAVIAKGDEVLDWREMAGRHAGARIKLLEGSDHGLADFDRHMADVLHFLGLG